MTNFSLIFSSSKYFLTALESTLLMMLNTGLRPVFVRYVMFSLNVAIVEVSVKYFTGVANIAFNNQSYSTKIAVFTSIDLIGDFPVKSTYMVNVLGFRVAWYVNRSFSLSVVIGGCIYLLV